MYTNYRCLIARGFKFRSLSTEGNILILDLKDTKIVEGKWTIIHQLDINPIIFNFKAIHQNVEELKNSSKIVKYRYIYDRVDIILNHVKEICNHLYIQT